MSAKCQKRTKDIRQKIKPVTRKNQGLLQDCRQSSGYSNGGPNGTTGSEDPYYFGSIALSFDLNSYLTLQGYYRGFTGEAGTVQQEKGLQSRASLSLRLTF